MKLINKFSIDRKNMTGINQLEKEFGCRIKEVLVYKLDLENGVQGALLGYYNKRLNTTYINISKNLDGVVSQEGCVYVREDKYGIQADIIDDNLNAFDKYGKFINEMALEIFKKENIVEVKS